MDLEDFFAIGALFFLAFVMVVLVGLGLSDRAETRDVRVCETVVTETGTQQRCWDEQEVVN